MTQRFQAAPFELDGYAHELLYDCNSDLGNAIVLQRRGMVFGASMPMITELVNDSNVQVWP